MDYAVVKGVGHILVHCPSLLIYGHALQEDMKEGADKSLDLLLPHLRKYKEAVNYLPNQVYIGNLEPEVLGDYDQPWWDNKNILRNAKRFGSYGEIIPQDEFFALMKIVDVFDLVWLEKPFTAKIIKKLEKHSLLSTFDLQKLGEGKEKGEIEEEIEKNKALALINVDNDNCNLIGCVRYAHKSDTNLSAKVINLQ